MIVDTHVHIWEMPPVAPIGPTAPSFKALPDEPATAELLLEDMDANGVDKAFVVQTSWSTWDNTYVADAARRYPDRFVSIGLVDPLGAGNAAQAAYWMDDRGMAGFRLHPDYYPDTPILLRTENDAMFRAIDQRRGIIQVHNQPPNAHQLDTAAARYPNIKWLIDHMMYPQVAWAPRWEPYRPVLELARHANVFIKISDVHRRSATGFPHADTHPIVKAAIDAFGIERCLWGTGYPGHHRLKHGWPSLADELRLVREGFDWLSADDQDLMLGRNPQRLFALQPGSSVAESRTVI